MNRNISISETSPNEANAALIASTIRSLAEGYLQSARDGNMADSTVAQEMTVAQVESESPTKLIDKLHPCPDCMKSFRSRQQLAQHSLVHNGLRKYTCSHCDKAFKQLSHLQQHIRIHTGEKPYKCSLEGCNRAFAQLSNLQHHLRNHDDQLKKASSRLFECSICHRSYTNESSLKNHTLKMHVKMKPLEEIDGLMNDRKRKFQEEILYNSPTMVPMGAQVPSSEKLIISSRIGSDLDSRDRLHTTSNIGNNIQRSQSYSINLAKQEVDLSQSCMENSMPTRNSPTVSSQSYSSNVLKGNSEMPPRGHNGRMPSNNVPDSSFIAQLNLMSSRQECASTPQFTDSNVQSLPSEHSRMRQMAENRSVHSESSAIPLSSAGDERSFMSLAFSHHIASSTQSLPSSSILQKIPKPSAFTSLGH